MSAVAEKAGLGSEGLVRNVTGADDVVQETYLRAYRSWHTFERGSDARRWLFTICRNAFLRTRERARHQVELEDGDVEALASNVEQADGNRHEEDEPPIDRAQHPSQDQPDK